MRQKNSMRLNPHLSFNGHCKEAFEFYGECLGGQITMMLTYGASPAAASAPDFPDKIMHATLKVGDQILTGADVAPNAYHKPQGFALQLNIDDSAQALLIFNKLASKGMVQLPLQSTFWAERYGILTDEYGVPWEINCGRRG